MDLRLTKENMKYCNLVISSFWFIGNTSFFLHLLNKSQVISYDIIGKYITRPVSSSNNIHLSGYYRDPSNLKLESQNIIGFIGRIKDCQKWKSKTECAFGGSGYNLLLYDALFSEKKQMNRIVYS